MTYRPGKHVYLAAPFFNDTQRDVCDFIEGFETFNMPIYSPRHDGGVLKPDASNDDRNRIFQSNCNAVNVSPWMLAVIDDFDTGVLWEMGFGYARGVPTLVYSDVEGRGLNVMLAGSAKLGFINGREELGKLLTKVGKEEMDPQRHFPRNTWAGEIQ